MEKVTRDEIVMKPKWYFAVGSALMMAGLVSSGLLATFLFSLMMFLARQHGPNGQWRLQLILESFPLWIPILAISGLALGLWMLKKYDFSYQKNFLLIALGFIFSIILTAFLLNYTGLDNIWMKKGPLRQFYQQNTKNEQSSDFRIRRHGGGYRQRSLNNL